MLAWETRLYLSEGNTDWIEHSMSIKAQNFKKNEGVKKKNWETDGNWWCWCEVRSVDARISGTTGNNVSHKSCRTWWKVLFLILLKSLWSVLCFQPSLYSWCSVFVTLWTVVHQAPLSMVFSRQEYWNGLPFPPPGEFSWPRDQTHVSYIGRQIPYNWATWEDPLYAFHSPIPQTTCHACWCWWRDNVFYFLNFIEV